MIASVLALLLQSSLIDPDRPKYPGGDRAMRGSRNEIFRNPPEYSDSDHHLANFVAAGVAMRVVDTPRA